MSQRNIIAVSAIASAVSAQQTVSGQSAAIPEIKDEINEESFTENGNGNTDEKTAVVGNEAAASGNDDDTLPDDDDDTQQSAAEQDGDGEQVPPEPAEDEDVEAEVDDVDQTGETKDTQEEPNENENDEEKEPAEDKTPTNNETAAATEQGANGTVKEPAAPTAPPTPAPTKHPNVDIEADASVPRGVRVKDLWADVKIIPVDGQMKYFRQLVEDSKNGGNRTLWLKMEFDDVLWGPFELYGHDSVTVHRDPDVCGYHKYARCYGVCASLRPVGATGENSWLNHPRVTKVNGKDKVGNTTITLGPRKGCNSVLQFSEETHGTVEIQFLNHWTERGPYTTSSFIGMLDDTQTPVALVDHDYLEMNDGPLMEDHYLWRFAEVTYKTSDEPTPAPTVEPTLAPTSEPTVMPTPEPTNMFRQTAAKFDRDDDGMVYAEEIVEELRGVTRHSLSAAHGMKIVRAIIDVQSALLKKFHKSIWEGDRQNEKETEQNNNGTYANNSNNTSATPLSSPATGNYSSDISNTTSKNITQGQNTTSNENKTLAVGSSRRQEGDQQAADDASSSDKKENGGNGNAGPLRPFSVAELTATQLDTIARIDVVHTFVLYDKKGNADGWLDIEDFVLYAKEKMKVDGTPMRYVAQRLHGFVKNGLDLALKIGPIDLVTYARSSARSLQANLPGMTDLSNEEITAIRDRNRVAGRSTGINASWTMGDFIEHAASQNTTTDGKNDTNSLEDSAEKIKNGSEGGGKNDTGGGADDDGSDNTTQAQAGNSSNGISVSTENESGDNNKTLDLDDVDFYHEVPWGFKLVGLGIVVTSTITVTLLCVMCCLLKPKPIGGARVGGKSSSKKGRAFSSSPPTAPVPSLSASSSSVAAPGGTGTAAPLLSCVNEEDYRVEQRAPGSPVTMYNSLKGNAPAGVLGGALGGHTDFRGNFFTGKLTTEDEAHLQGLSPNDYKGYDYDGTDPNIDSTTEIERLIALSPSAGAGEKKKKKKQQRVTSRSSSPTTPTAAVAVAPTPATAMTIESKKKEQPKSPRSRQIDDEISVVEQPFAASPAVGANNNKKKGGGKKEQNEPQPRKRRLASLMQESGDGALLNKNSNSRSNVNSDVDSVVVTTDDDDKEQEQSTATGVTESQLMRQDLGLSHDDGDDDEKPQQWLRRQARRRNDEDDL